jgi:hypothetical protein
MNDNRPKLKRSIFKAKMRQKPISIWQLIAEEEAVLSQEFDRYFEKQKSIRWKFGRRPFHPMSLPDLD